MTNDEKYVLISKVGPAAAALAGAYEGGGGEGTVASVNGKTGEVVLSPTDIGAATAQQGTKADSAVQPEGLTKTAVGLGNVDNTSDATKPISTAQQTALNLKANQTDLVSGLSLKASKVFTNPLATVAYFGDSRTAQNESTASVNVPAPLARSQMWWMQTLSYGRLLRNHLYNFGVSGDSTTDLKNRVVNNTANAYGISPNSAGYSIAVILIGTNSVNSLIPLATMQSDVNTVISTLKGWGKRVVVISEWPRGYGTTPGTTGYLSTDSQKLMYRYANWLRSLRSDTELTVVDVWPRTADPASTAATPLPNMINTDGLHNSPGIGYITGKLLSQELSKFVPPANYTPSSNGDLYDATANPNGCLNPNPMLQGTTGTLSTGGSGVSPTSYALSSSGGVTVTGSNVTLADGRPAFRMVVTGTTTTTNAYVRLRVTGIQASVSPGDNLVAGYEYVVSAGHVNFAAPTVMIDPNVAAERVYGGLGFGGDNQMPASVVESHSGVSLSAVYTVPATVPASLGVEFRPMFTATGVASSLTIDIVNCFIRKV